MTNDELPDEIELAVSNKAHLHIEDKRRIACIFFKLLQKRNLDLGDVETAVDALPGYSESSRDIIKQIASVIDMLAYC